MTELSPYLPTYLVSIYFSSISVYVIWMMISELQDLFFSLARHTMISATGSPFLVLQREIHQGDETAEPREAQVAQDDLMTQLEPGLVLGTIDVR